MKTLKDIRNGLLSEERDETTEKVEMAETQLHFICYAAKEILEYIQMGGEIEEWYQNKLSKVHSDVESLHSYVEGEKRRTGMVDEEVEQVDESYNWDKLVRKHLKDARNSNNTRKQRKYAESMASRALEASKIADPEKAYRHYMGVGVGNNMDEEVEQVEEGRKLMSLKPPSAAKRLRDFTKPVSQIPAPKGGHSLSDDEERVWDPRLVGYVVRKKK